MSRLPAFLRRSAGPAGAAHKVSHILEKYGVETVCNAAACPNRNECYSRGTATFMILGPGCSRACRFCNIAARSLQPPDKQEPIRIGKAAAALGLKHVVITMTTRDDLADGGTQHLLRTLSALRRRCPAAAVELLISDLQGDMNALNTIIAAGPDCLNHNIEMPRSLFERYRPEGSYDRSMAVLAQGAQSGIPVKSGFMLGLGETDRDIQETIDDLCNTGVQILTIGQYLAPRDSAVPVARFPTPAEFAAWARYARSRGIELVQASPYTRSSYRAEDLFSHRAEHRL
ncbi:MAG: lipoyl synthase [Fibrobacterota bacterium]